MEHASLLFRFRHSARITVPGVCGDRAFWGCSALAAITFGQPTAPTLPANVFYGVKDTGTLYHPAGYGGYDKILALLPPGWQSSTFTPYKVIVHPATGGTATASPSLCGAGTAVTLTARPAEGYAFVRWMTNPNLNTTDWAQGSSANHPTATFTMPGNYDINVTPVFSRSKFNLSGTVTAGAQPVSEPITVTLYHANGTYISSVTTQGGAYSFPSLSPGDYKVTAMGVTVNSIPYYQTTLDVTIDAHDVTDANIALETNVTSVAFLNAVPDGVRYYTTSTQVTLTFSAPIALTQADVEWGGTTDAAEMDGLVSANGSDISQVWILKIKNVKYQANGNVGVGVKVNAPAGYYFDSLLTPVKLTTLYVRIEPPAITAAAYSTNTPLVGGEIAVTPGTYTPNEAGAAGAHQYAWYRAYTATVYGERVADPAPPTPLPTPPAPSPTPDPTPTPAPEPAPVPTTPAGATGSPPTPVPAPPAGATEPTSTPDPESPAAANEPTPTPVPESPESERNDEGTLPDKAPRGIGWVGYLIIPGILLLLVVRLQSSLAGNALSMFLMMRIRHRVVKNDANFDNSKTREISLPCLRTTI